MDGYNPELLHVGHNTRASVSIQSEAPLVKSYLQSVVRVPKTQESMMTSEVMFNTILGHHRVGPREQGIVYISLPDFQEKLGMLLYHEPEPTEPVHFLHNIQNDHPQADKGGHSSRAMGSLTQHQVSILPHSNCKETSLLSLLQVERQSLPV